MKEGARKREWKRRIRRERKREKGMRGTRCGSRGSAGKEGKVHEGLIDGKKKGERKKGRGDDQGRMGSRQEVNE